MVGPGKQECIVCSRSVSRASPVFQRMLYGSFAESKPSKGEWVVSLPEDDAEVLALMLHIVHGQFDKVPLTPSEETMYSIAILTDKYDMAASLRPWATSWLEHLKTNEGGTGDDHGGQRIWIAWELGDADLFEEEATNLLVSSKASLFTAPHRDTPLLETLRTLELIGMSQSHGSSNFEAEVVIRVLMVPSQNLSWMHGIRWSAPSSARCAPFSRLIWALATFLGQRARSNGELTYLTKGKPVGLWFSGASSRL